MQLYQIEYQWDGYSHGDTAILESANDAQKWLKKNLPGVERGDKLTILSCSPINELADAKGRVYKIEHTIDNYLNEVLEGSE